MKEPAPRTHSNGIVAVVDGDPAVRNSLQFSLGIEGYAVRTFGAAAELLDDPELMQFACIIVDQNLRMLSGLELVARLRDRAVMTPAILIISRPSEGVRRQAGKAGVPILEKPLLGNALAATIQSALKP